MVIAGFSLKGPAQTPFMIRDNVDVRDVLGECRMADDYIVAKEHGVTPLLFRMNGSHGEVILYHEKEGIPVLLFRTIDAHDEVNQIHIRVCPTHFIIYGLNSEHMYFFADYKNVDELSMAIKRDLYLGSGELDVSVLQNTTLADICLTEKDLYISGGDDGYNHMSFTHEELFEEKIDAQTSLIKESIVADDGVGYVFSGELANFTIDTFVFSDIPYEYMTEELLKVFGYFAETKTSNQSVFCSVVLGSEMFSSNRYDELGSDTYKEQLSQLIQKSPHKINLGNSSKHIEVVVGTRDSVDINRSFMSCASTYASMRYALKDRSHSATNKVLTMNALYSKELQKDDVANLTSNGYICIVPSIKNGFTPFSSRNIYPLKSIQQKPHYLRSVYADVQTLIQAFSRYIGQPFHFLLLQQVMSEINKKAEELLEIRSIYRNVRVDVGDFSRESISISIIFEMYGEVEAIRTSLSYSSSGEVNVSW